MHILYSNLYYLHRIVAENINNLDGDFIPLALFVFKLNAFNFQRTVFLCPEALPFIFKDIIARPMFGDFAGFGILDPDYFPLALKVKIYRPVVNPVRPAFGQYLFGNFPDFVFAYLYNIAVFNDNFISAVSLAG